jgi:drug/metabolite transporter (DMT)-like permease
MLFLCLAILSSSAISVLMRFSAGKINAKLSMLGYNYLICALLGAAYAGFDLLQVQISGFPLTVVLGFVSGIVYLGGFVLVQWNTAKNGIVLSSVFMKLGLLVPMVLSVALFRELPTSNQILGFCVAVLAIVLINLKGSAKGGRFRWQLLAMLILCGGSDAMAKVFEVMGPAVLSNQYLFYTFAFALVLCIGLVVYKKERPGIRELLFGAAIGIPNFFSAKFLLLSLKDLPAVVVFPSFSIATMMVATLAGVLFFRERLEKLQWLAVLFIIIALLLLNI